MRHDWFICVTWLIHMCRPWRLWIYSQLVAYSCVTRVMHVCDVTWLMYMCDVTHSYVTWLIYVWLDSCTCDRPWRQWICSRLTASLLHDMSHSNVTWLTRVRHDSFICDVTLTASYLRNESCHIWMRHWCATWLIHMRDVTDTHVIGHDVCRYARTWLRIEYGMFHSYVWCDITHLYEWHDSFICDVSPSFKCDMTHSCVTWLIHMWHDSFVWVTWLIHMWRLSLIQVWHDSFICDMTHSYVTWLLQTMTSVDMLAASCSRNGIVL